MLEAGITSQDAITHPIHIWPLKEKRINTVANITLEQAKKNLIAGRRFCDAENNIYTIYDLPLGTRVIIHCKRHQRINFSI